jgi:hypothetical protein
MTLSAAGLIVAGGCQSDVCPVFMLSQVSVPTIPALKHIKFIVNILNRSGIPLTRYACIRG